MGPHGGGPMPMGPEPGMMMPGGGPGHFLQQQNTVYVFTTSLANEAAAAVKSGQFRNIIEFHRSLPQTNEYLKNMHLQQQMGPGSRGPPNESLTMEQLKKRNEKLGKLKNISTMITNQNSQAHPSNGIESNPTPPPTKRGRGGDKSHANANNNNNNNNNGPHMNEMGMYGGPPPGQMPNDQFNPMLGPNQNPYQQDWNRMSKFNMI